MASRTTFTKNGVTYKLWLCVDTENKKGFPEALVAGLSRLKSNPKWAHMFKMVKSHRIIMTPDAFEKVQADLDVVPKTMASLYAEHPETGEVRPMKSLQKCKMYGDKIEYDNLLRALRF